MNVLDEEEEMDYKRSFMSDTTSGQPEAMHSRVVPAAANWNSIEEEEDERDQSVFLAELHQRHAPGAKVLFDPSAKKTPNPNTPCFAFFYDGQCSMKCGRDHSAQAMLDLRDRQFRKFTNSKWVKPIWIQGEVDNLLKGLASPKNLAQPYPSRQASVESSSQPEDLGSDYDQLRALCGGGPKEEDPSASQSSL